MSEPRPSVVVLGVYGKGNFGDEALLEVIVDEVRDFLPGCEVQVFCSGPEAVRQRFGLAAEHRNPGSGFWRKQRIIRNSRLVVIGGGTTLCDHGGVLADLQAVVTWFFWLLVARFHGVRTLAYAQGFGPAQSRVVRFGLRLLRWTCDELSVRDDASRALVERHGGWAAHFTVAGDPVAMSDRFLPQRVVRLASRNTRDRVSALGDYVLLAVRYPKLGTLDEAALHVEAVARAAARLCLHAGGRVVLFPTHLSDRFADDRLVMDRLEHILAEEGVPPGRVVRASWQSLDDAALWLQSAAIVFGDRLHALIVAALNHVPVGGVVVENKIAGCLDDFLPDDRLARIIDPATLDRARTERAVEQLWDHRDSHDDVFARLIEAYRARREANLEALWRALGEPEPALLTGGAEAVGSTSRCAPVSPAATIPAGKGQGAGARYGAR